ncbi:MAG: hypothetical protein ACPGSC_10875, partial [Granulosicoccaceae bacterium]
MRNKLRLAEVQQETTDSSLLELSALEVRSLMQRYGVRSEACPEELELMDLMLALQEEGVEVVPAPQFV